MLELFRFNFNFFYFIFLNKYNKYQYLYLICINCRYLSISEMFCTFKKKINYDVIVTLVQKLTPCAEIDTLCRNGHPVQKLTPCANGPVNRHAL